MRNVFYYKIYYYARCPQQVQLLLIDYIFVWAADHKLFIRSAYYWDLTEGRLELLIMTIYLFWVLVCVTHNSLHHSWKAKS